MTVATLVLSAGLLPVVPPLAAWYSAMPMAPRPHFHRKGMVFPLSLGAADGIPCGSR